MFNYRQSVGILLITCVLGSGVAAAQSKGQDPSQESERSDKFTGGKIETAEFQPGQPNVKLTLNIPAFRLSMWQNGKEVKT